MAFKSHTLTLTSSLLVIAFLFGESNYVTEGFQVSLTMYFNTIPEGDHLYFETKQYNLDAYSELLSKVQLVCGLGFWPVYIGNNFTDNKYYFGSTNSNQTRCDIYNIPYMNMRSFRFLGSSDPTKDSLSLYPGRYQAFDELLIERQAYAGITSYTGSLSSTGKSDWTLFEGLNFNGNYFCWPAPSNGSYYAAWDYIPPTWNLTTIGSVFKGCDIDQIENYRRNNNL